jgi:hypothetical protein
MSNLAIDYSNPVALRKAGIDALRKELGPLGMVLFMLQFDNGYGNYTDEREDLLKDVIFDELDKELVAMQS